jgi:hypothetical protein
VQGSGALNRCKNRNKTRLNTEERTESDPHWTMGALHTCWKQTLPQNIQTRGDDGKWNKRLVEIRISCALPSRRFGPIVWSAAIVDELEVGLRLHSLYLQLSVRANTKKRDFLGPDANSPLAPSHESKCIEMRRLCVQFFGVSEADTGIDRKPVCRRVKESAPNTRKKSESSGRWSAD